MGLDLALYERLYNRQDSRELLLDQLGALADNLWVCVRMVAMLTKDGPWRLFFGEAVVSPERTSGPRLDLGKIRVVSECISLSDFVNRVRGTFESGCFTCGDIQVDATAIFRQWSFSRFPSAQHFSPWPCLVAEGRQERSESRLGPSSAISDGGNLYFNDGSEVVAWMTTLSVFHGARDARLGNFSIIIEDRRARIIRTERQGEEYLVEAEGSSLSGLTLAGRIREEGQPVHQFSCDLQQKNWVVVPRGPFHFGAAVTIDDNELIDVVDGHVRAAVLDFEVEDHEDDIESSQRVAELLHNGEDARCEYKPWVLPRRSDHKFVEVIKTVVAMANGGGGNIIIGADDNAQVKSLDGKILGPYLREVSDAATDGEEGELPANRNVAAVDLYARKVRDEVQIGVNPSVDFGYEVVSTDAGEVLLITVEPGMESPYEVANSHEVYVRSNATNRRPTREELRQLHEPLAQRSPPHDRATPS